jgi:hypothetical protein
MAPGCSALCLVSGAGARVGACGCCRAPAKRKIVWTCARPIRCARSTTTVHQCNSACWHRPWHRFMFCGQVANRADCTGCTPFVQSAGSTDAAPVQLERGAPWRAPRRNRLALCFPGFQAADCRWCSIWCDADMDSKFLRIKAGAPYHRFSLGNPHEMEAIFWCPHFVPTLSP